jgi:pimeloyl-ACP methyl ester carboxylesterase
LAGIGASEVAERKHLVIVLPGIGGSVLARPMGAGFSGHGKVVWDAGFLDVADLVLHPGRMSLSEQPALRPVGLIKAKRLVPGWTVIEGYDRLRQSLEGLPGAVLDWGEPAARIPGANIVAVPYDFRRSIVEAACRLDDEVRHRLAELAGSEGERRDRVVLVAHSMGGLVARYWLGPLGGWPLCRSLVTLGTPHRGAPKALDVLVNGIRLGGHDLSRLSGLLQEWPAMAELLPRYPAIWDADADVARYPHELTLPEGLGDCTGGPRAPPVPGLEGAAAAFRVHEDIQAAWDAMPRSATSVEPRLGWSHPTLGAARWKSGVLTVTKDLPTWLHDLEGWKPDHGDGTVPAISAVPIELAGAATGGMRSQEKHGRIASSGSVVDLLEQYEERAPTRAVQGDERGAALGLDIEELQSACRPISLTSHVREVARDAVAGHPVWATLTPAGGQRRLDEIRLDWDGEQGAFVGALHAQPAGLYDVTVQARAVPGAGDLVVADSVQVIDGE